MTRSATVAGDERLIDVDGWAVPRSKLAAFYELRRRLGRNLSVSEFTELTGDYGPFNAVIAGFVGEQNAKVGRAVRQLSAPRCRRCDHLKAHHADWGPCTWHLCTCPGSESPG